MTRAEKFNVRYALVTCVTLACGCGGEHFPLAPVSGVVTLDGQPLAGARIGFEPRRSGEARNAGYGSYAQTDSQGHYELRTLDDRPGAVVTTHDVRISTFRGPDNRRDEMSDTSSERVPDRYFQPAALTFTVGDSGSSSADFHLTTKP